jgi:murein DD-endopeptidase MepM/ murein hydrolase activator NlpD
MRMRPSRLLAFVGAALIGAGCGTAAKVALPRPPALETDIFLEPDYRIVEQVVPSRSTLADLLEAHEFERTAANRFVDAVRTVFNPRRLRSGHDYRFVLGNDGTFRRFEYHIDEDAFLRVSGPGEACADYCAELVPYSKMRHETALRGAIDAAHSSLVAAINGGGENVLLAIQMAEIFSGEIDFNNDLRRGDRFDVLFEKVYREEQFSSYGEVLAAEFVNDGREIRAFRFHVPGESEAQYFDAEGRSLKRLFLRSPFRFEPRITSRFSYRRLHPVLGGRRPHLGVDYGAPTGTPVIAVANGSVVSAGRSGGSGNMVRLRHTNGYETYYLHLSAFAPGIRRGARVTQGQVIGRVGATGLATGPHLDYRIRKKGTFVNPLLEHRNLPPGDPVPEEHLPAFHEMRDEARGRLQAALPSSASPGHEAL